jgi:excisionase family DNA binding protein
MIIKFNTLKELTSWLLHNKKLNNKLWLKGYLLFDLKFDYESELINYLESNSITQIIYTSTCIIEGFKYKNYEYKIDHILFNTNYLTALESNSYINPNIQERLLTIKEVCNFLSLTKPSIYKLFESNQLPYYEILSQRKVKLTDLIKFIESKKKK